MLMSSGSKPAKLFFQPNGFRMLSGGDHVVCAVSGVPVALEDLRYWSVDRQEAYASCALAVQAISGRTPAAAPADTGK